MYYQSALVESHEAGVEGELSKDIITLFASIAFNSALILMFGLLLSSLVSHFRLVNSFQCYEISLRFHNKMVKRVLRSPVEFFDSNPIGRIITRFSKDTNVIDRTLFPTFFYTILVSLKILTFQSFLKIFIQLIASIMAFYYQTPVILLLLLVVFRLQAQFSPAVSSSRRRATAGKTTLNSYFIMLYQGFQSIRATNKQGYFRQKVHSECDKFSNAMFTHVGAKHS